MYPFGRSCTTTRWWVSVAVLVVALATAWPAPSGAADAGAEFTLEATTTTSNLHDGQGVRLTLKAAPGVVVISWNVRQCRMDASDGAYDSLADMLPPAGNCTQGTGVSSSGDFLRARSSGSHLDTAAAQPAGASLTYLVGVGSIELNSPPVTLACTPATPCRLVSAINTLTSKSVVTVPLTFNDANPLSSCGGTAKEAVKADGSDRFVDAYTTFTVAACKRPNQSGAIAPMAFGGEGEAVTAFTRGDVDLAYTGAGYTEAAKLGPDTPEDRRPAVLTPVALNAAVIATAPDYFSPTGDKAPYLDLRLTVDEVADLLTGGVPWLDTLSGGPVRTRNPLLAPGLARKDQGESAHWYGSSESSTPNWLITRHVATLAPSRWKTPLTGGNGKSRAVDPSFVLADPPFSSDAFSPRTGRESLAKVVATTLFDTIEGPSWFVTDLVTAKALGLSPVSIQNASGDFVAPTPDSLRAAVPTMTEDASGARIASPSATVTAGQVQPYPLTFVEYAMAPAQPLVDPVYDGNEVVACTPRPGAQANLTDWLTFITTTGESLLPEGFVPITPELATEAGASIAKVGASPLRGACAPKPATTSTTAPSTTTVPTVTTSTAPRAILSPPTVPFDPPADLPADPGSSFSTTPVASPSAAPAGGASFAGTPPAASAGDGAAAPATTVATPTAVTTPPSTDPLLPEYAGSRSASGQTALLALVGIVLLSTVAALATSGRARRRGEALGGFVAIGRSTGVARLR